MSEKHLFDSDISKTNNLAKIEIRYVVHNKSDQVRKIAIYNDDSCKDVIFKIASLHSNCISDHIFAWYSTEGGIIPLGFIYSSLLLNKPYNNKKPDPRFVQDGNRVVVMVDKSIQYNLINTYKINKLYYTTIYDYLDYLKLPKNKNITDEICQEKTNMPIKDVYNGLIVKYWPFVTQEQATNLSGTTNPEKLKLESQVVEQMLNHANEVYSAKKLIIPTEYDIQLFSVSNESNIDKTKENIVHLARLFSDIPLGKTKMDKTSIPFSKITLEDYTNKYCKLLKDTIVVHTIDENRYVSKEVFSSWFKNQITSVPSTNLKYVDEKNSVVFKFYRESKIITLIIYSDGVAKIFFSGHSYLLSQSYIKESIGRVNQFITRLNKKKIFSDKPIALVADDYTISMEYLTAKFIYPLKNYKVDILIQLMKNMTTFIRYNKNLDTKIYCVYKRVNQYGQSISNVINSLQRSKRNLTKEQIINELEILFNISNDEAQEEYENWESDPSSRYFKQGEEGVELILDLEGTDIKVDIVGVSSYEMSSRIYHLLNYIMTYYDNFLNTKKDPMNFMKKEGISLTERVEQAELEQELIINEELEEILETQESQTRSKDVLEQQSESHTAERQTAESKVQEIIDEASSSSSSNRNQLSVRSASTLKLESDESSLDSDLDIGLIDEDDSVGGSKQTGGYNVNRYYLNRLKKYDNDMFKNYNNIPRKNRFAVKCHTTADRQPIPVTKRDLERYEQSGEGEGVAYSEALNIPGRDPDIYYICPKYWDIKDERPRDPLKKEEFKDVIVDNKMTTGQKKNTDNYVLVRDESGYWKEAGDNIERYTIKLMKGSHPDGYELPCCNAPRKGAIRFPEGWEVEILVNTKGKYQWKSAKVKSSTKKDVTVIQGGRIITVPIGEVRRARNKNTLSDRFPLDIDSYGYVDKRIKQLVQLPLDTPEVPDNNYGLVRKGVFRASVKGDQSFLESMAEILSDKNSTSKNLVDNIIKDLYDLHKQDKSIILSIAGGGFVNKFKMDISEFTSSDKFRFLERFKKYINNEKSLSFIKKNINRVVALRQEEGDDILSWDELFNLTLGGRGIRERLIVNNEASIFSAIVQFEKYLNDKSEIITDEFVIPVLTTIAKHKSRSTFSKVYKNLSIIVFENIQEDITISPPLGNFNETCDSMILLYKERRNMYEPIFYRKYDTHMGILRGVMDESEYMYDKHEEIKTCIESIQKKIKGYTSSSMIDTNYLSLEENLTDVMDACGLPIEAFVYDNYCKVVYVKTINNVLIPITPTGVKEYMITKKKKDLPDPINLLYISSIKDNELPKYNDVKHVLSMIDRKSDKKYLDTISVSVVNKSETGKLELMINEIILKDNVYIPIYPEPYDDKIIKEDVIINESYTRVDKYLGLIKYANDARSEYLVKQQYLKTIQSLLFQRVFIEIKDTPLMNKIETIKNHPIMLHQHKAERIFNLIDDIVRTKIIELDTGETGEINYNVYENNHKLIIKQTRKDIDAETIYKKMIKLMIECLLNYDSETDYEQFLQLDINLSKLKSSVNKNELVFSYKDIFNDYHLDYFVRYSSYIRNFVLPDEPIQKSKLIQVHRLKDRTIKQIQGVIKKEYPQIIHKLFGRKIEVTGYKNSDTKESDVLFRILNEIFKDDEITKELIDSLIVDDKLNQQNLDRLTSYEKFNDIAICCILKPFEKINHSIIESFHRKIPTNKLLVFCQTRDELFHVEKKDGEFTINDLKN